MQEVLEAEAIGELPEERRSCYHCPADQEKQTDSHDREARLCPPARSHGGAWDGHSPETHYVRSSQRLADWLPAPVRQAQECITPSGEWGMADESLFRIGARLDPSA